MTLAVELGEGFSEDTVAVLVDGREVWHRTGVTTNYSVGIADMVRVAVQPGATVEIRVRGMARSLRWEPDDTANHLRMDISPAGELSLGAAPEGPVF